MLLRFLTRRDGHTHVLSHGRSVVLAAGLSLAFAAVAGAMLHWGAPYIAQQRWRNLIEDASPEQRRALLGELASRPDATPLLIDLLDHDRPEIATAAKSTITSQVDLWRDLPRGKSTAKVVALARTLAEHTPSFRARGRHLAANVVDVIIDWPLNEAANATEFLLDCETVLRNDPGGADLWDAAPEFDFSATATPIGALPFRTQASTGNVDWEGVPPISGGGLSAEPHSVPLDFAMPEQESDELTNDVAEPTEPRRLRNEPTPTEIYEPLAIPLELAPEFEKRQGNDAPILSNEPARITSEPIQNPEERSDVDLMRDLHDTTHSAAAEEELRRRGFDNLRIAIARRLTDDDPQVRKELADALPNIAGVSAGPWLKELANDPDAGVRHIAIAILGTSNDPSIDRLLGQLRQQESNPQVAELIDGILEKRR